MGWSWFKEASIEVNLWRQITLGSCACGFIGKVKDLSSFYWFNLFSLFPGWSCFVKCVMPSLKLPERHSCKLLVLNGGYRAAFAPYRDEKGAKRSSVDN